MSFDASDVPPIGRPNPDADCFYYYCQEEGAIVPDRYYRARNEPPSHLDHILAHPGLSTMTAWWIFVGALLVFDGFHSASFVGTTTVTNFWLYLSLGLAIGIGGLLSFWGAVTTSKRLDRAWDAQRLGHHLAGAGWVAFSVIAAVAHPENLLVWTGGVTNATLALLTIFSVSRTEAAKRREMRRHGWEA